MDASWSAGAWAVAACYLITIVVAMITAALLHALGVLVAKLGLKDDEEAPAASVGIAQDVEASNAVGIAVAIAAAKQYQDSH